jgi:cobalt/nickel transport system permease protein
MHISEGVLSAPVLAGGALTAAAGLGWSLRKLPWNHLMETGLLSAAFFVASLIHFPVGPSSVHLIMNGLIGAILGWATLPALAVALFLQALLFQFGGISTLGVNICIMALPAVLCGRIFRPFFLREKSRTPAAFFCGFLSVGLSGILLSLVLALSGDIFWNTAGAVLFIHIPVMFLEGIVTAVMVRFIFRVSPELLTGTAEPHEL